MSKNVLVDETIGIPRLIGRTVTGVLAYWLQVNRHRGGRSFTQAFLRNVRGFGNDVKKDSIKPLEWGGTGQNLPKEGEALPSVG